MFVMKNHTSRSFASGCDEREGPDSRDDYNPNSLNPTPHGARTGTPRSRALSFSAVLVRLDTGYHRVNGRGSKGP